MRRIHALRSICLLRHIEGYLKPNDLYYRPRIPYASIGKSVGPLTSALPKQQHQKYHTTPRAIRDRWFDTNGYVVTLVCVSDAELCLQCDGPRSIFTQNRNFRMAFVQSHHGGCVVLRHYIYRSIEDTLAVRAVPP